jgi:NAD(P)-dependent dehydrogenase (short-subunit alcohol dehydrogenase family)
LTKWTASDVPAQNGRIVVITGGNGGLGYATAKVLAQRGAQVVLACRSEQRGAQAAARIQQDAPAASVSCVRLDLSDLASVRDCVAQLRTRHARIDVLINNAGVMVPPLSRTAQGFELQMGTNHLGHFALTAGLFPLLQHAHARIVVVASNAQRMGRIELDDLNWERRRYQKWLAYGQSKLANMMFACELARRAPAMSPTVVASHPGFTQTDLTRTDGLADLSARLIAMRVDQGALTTLRAATDTTLKSGSYIGPSGLTQMHGHPVEVPIPRHALDKDMAARLWERSEELTAVRFLST